MEKHEKLVDIQMQKNYNRSVCEFVTAIENILYTGCIIKTKIGMSAVRVIAGKARHMILKTVPGTDTRPTTDRIKETLFNILQFQLEGERFLDLFSGSGAIGIEALSRGASFAAFVEKDRRAAQCIKDNVKATHLEKNAEIYTCDVLSAIAGMNGQEPFRFIFMDPPYKEQLEVSALQALKHSTLLDENTVIIVEALLNTSFDFADTLGFHITRVKEYKTNKHVFLCLNED